METIQIPNQNRIRDLLKLKKVEYAAIFGSRAKGTAHQDSDYDFLIEFKPESQYSIIDIVSLKNALKDLLGQEVDLITTYGVNPKLLDEIESTKKVIYDYRKR